MFLPLGLDDAPVNRWPVVSFAILALNVLVWVAISWSEPPVRLEQGYRGVVEYWARHPQLVLSPEVESV